MTFSCSHEGCFPDTTCALGHIDRVQCEHWNGIETSSKDEEEKVEEERSDIPWNGYVLGMSDLFILGGRGRPAVIGLVGLADSGKTSLLSFLYFQLLNFGRIGKWMFAGSWTIGGWESVVQYGRWSSAVPPSFPPHTSSEGRYPGILHVTLRCPESGQLRDVMFTDAPGEWFTHWSQLPTGEASAGARWIIEHSDALLLLIDSDALANTEKLPATRRATRDLIERVGAKNMSHVAVVWTKDDVVVPEQAMAALQTSYSRFLPNAPVLRTTVNHPQTIEECFEKALAIASSRNTSAPILEPRLSDDPFLAFRGINASV